MARAFPGTSNRHLLPGDQAEFDLTGTALTLHMWVKPAINNAIKDYMAKYNTTAGARQYGLFGTAGGKVQALISDGSADDTVDSATTITTGVWHPVGLVKDGTGTDSLRVFLDGIRDAAMTSTKSMIATSSSLVLGNSHVNRPLNGDACEFAVWNVALTDLEMASLGKGVCPLLIRPNNLVGYWPCFGTVSTSTAEPDYSGKNNDASNTNSVASALHAPVMPFVPPLRYAPIAPTLPGYFDSAQIYLDLQPSSVELAEYIETAEVLVDLQASGVDELLRAPTIDSATVLLDLSVLGGECFSTFSAAQFGEGEANLRWSGNAALRWSGDAELRWQEAEITLEGVHC